METKIKIKLTKENGVRIAELFTVKEVDDVVLSFETEYSVSAAKIYLQNGDVCGAYDFKKDFTVPDKFMFTGRLFGRVEMLVAGRVAKRWEIFPIAISKTPDGVKLIDCLTSLEKRIEKIEKQHEIIQ